MSRAGILPVFMPSGVKAKFSEETRALVVEGSKGAQSVIIPEGVICNIEDNKITLSLGDEVARSRVLWGTCRSNVQNAVTGVYQQFTAVLDIFGVGFKAEIKGSYLLLSLGFSHGVFYKIPNELDIKVPKPTQVIVAGVSKQKVFMVASDLCKVRKYDPYKGKGVVLKGGIALRKEANKKK